MVGCTPQKRLLRLLTKHPYLLEQNDTLVTFKTPSVDTMFFFSKDTLVNRDTFVIRETKTRIYRHFDTLKVKQESLKDSVVVSQEVTIKENKSNIDKLSTLIEKFVYLVMATLLLLIVILIWNKSKKQ